MDTGHKTKRSFFHLYNLIFFRRNIAWAGVKSSLIDLLILDCLLTVCFLLKKKPLIYCENLISRTVIDIN